MSFEINEQVIALSEVFRDFTKTNEDVEQHCREHDLTHEHFLPACTSKRTYTDTYWDWDMDAPVFSCVLIDGLEKGEAGVLRIPKYVRDTLTNGDFKIRRRDYTMDDNHYISYGGQTGPAIDTMTDELKRFFPNAF